MENVDIYFTATCNLVRPFGIFHCHLGNLVIIWYIFPRFGILCQEKSGNPACIQHFGFIFRKSKLGLIIQNKPGQKGAPACAAKLDLKIFFTFTNFDNRSLKNLKTFFYFTFTDFDNTST
jgi:hypothetical protein